MNFVVVLFPDLALTFALVILLSLYILISFFIRINLIPFLVRSDTQFNFVLVLFYHFLREFNKAVAD